MTRRGVHYYHRNRLCADQTLKDFFINYFSWQRYCDIPGPALRNYIPLYEEYLPIDKPARLSISESQQKHSMNYGQVYTLWKTYIQIPSSYSSKKQNKSSLKLLMFSVGIVLNSAVLVIAGRQSMRWVSMSFVWVGT